jgi:proteasome lid subunit RPN8/RPN11
MDQKPAGLTLRLTGGVDVPAHALGQLRQYFYGAKLERGCGLTTNFEVIPFHNESGSPGWLVDMGPGDFGKFADLVFEGKLLAWGHNHPMCGAYPSRRDVILHQVPIDMIIYSNQDDEFCVYSPEYSEKQRAAILEDYLIKDNIIQK